MKQHEEIRRALTGPVPSVRTPFDRHGEVDYRAMRRMIEFDIEAGAKAILLTAGDSHYEILSDDEIAEVTRVAVEHVAGRAAVVAADRRFGTRKAVQFAAYARDLGAAAIMLRPPDWARSCTADSLAEHYGVAGEELPVMLVTNLFRGCEEVGLRAMKILIKRGANVCAVKDDLGDGFARRLAAQVHERWAVIAGGQKQNHLNMHFYGCDGYLSTFLTCVPSVAHRYWEAIKQRDFAEAVDVIRTIDMPFFEFISTFPGGFDACMHGMLELHGLAGRWRREPHHSLTDEEMARLKAFLAAKGLL